MNQETLYPKHGNPPEQQTGPGNVDNRRGVRDFYVAKAAEDARETSSTTPPCDERTPDGPCCGDDDCACPLPEIRFTIGPVDMLAQAHGQGQESALVDACLWLGIEPAKSVSENIDRIKAVGADRIDLWRHRAKLRDDISSLRSQLSTMQRERDEARAEAASLKAAGNIILDESGCEFCEVALRKIVEFDHDKTPDAPGYWVCADCYGEACARRSARIEELKAQLHPPSCPGCDSEQCERRGR